MRNLALGSIVILVSAVPAAAQQPSRILPPVPILVQVQLGGDSAPSRTVRLAQDRLYRLVVIPREAAVVVRTAANARGMAQTLALNPLQGSDTVPLGTGYLMTPASTGEYTISLTGGAAAARLSLHEVPPQTGDVRAVLGQEQLIFSAQVGDAPQYITLDTGIVYRIFQLVDVVLAPRTGSGLPIRMAPLVRGGGHGTPFIVDRPGEYGIQAAAGSEPGNVRIYIARADAAELACVRNPDTEGCRATRAPDGRKTNLTMLLVLITLPVAAYMLLAK